MEVSVGAAAAAVIGLVVGATLLRADPGVGATAESGPRAGVVTGTGPAAPGGAMLSGESAERRTPSAPPGGAPSAGGTGPGASGGSGDSGAPGKQDSGSAKGVGKDPGKISKGSGAEEKERGQRERETRAEGPSRHTDAEAVAYFQRSEAAKRVKDIRTVGGYLRIYTDLPESADNSRQALELCETGLEYLEERGVADPVIFVQAEFGENGNPVLANVLGPGDSNCRVTHPEPGG
ncbi:hypothetical protein GCM10010156_08640 [Planobispora rosea]|uniref:Uncharacterized protein n=1 Tax=Planobispora rosea TaxID=35762 RepID=A0A8J3WAP8_PLARO|nr:hypothetical protein [Planobispora rosea]GGS52241.1 hypothetical protein GCM10010156_08640 [Planobispora rosea]GIH83029.1 hypothetical protein Pro02_14370 [Planobispora rosea]